MQILLVGNNVDALDESIHARGTAVRERVQIDSRITGWQFDEAG